MSSPAPSAQRLTRALISAVFIIPAGLALNFTLNLVLARLLPVEEYGVFVFAHSLASMLAVLAALGFATSMMRFVSAYHVNGELGALKGILRSSLQLVCLASAFISVVLLSFSVAPTEYSLGLFWSAVLLIPTAVDAWRESTMRGLHRTAEGILPRQVLLPTSSMLLILAFDLSDLLSIMVCFVLSFAVLEMAGMLRLRALTSSLVPIIPVRRVKHWVGVSLPMAFATLAHQGLTKWDVVLLGFFVGMDATGPYGAAARTALLASVVLRVVNLVVGPTLSEYYHSGQFRKFKSTLIISSAASGALGLPIYIVVLFYPGEVMSFFGAGYDSAAPYLQVLASGQFVNLLSGSAGLALTMSKHQKLYLLIAGLASILSLLALMMLTPLYGAFGAAVATSLALVVFNVAQVLACVKLFWIGDGIHAV